MPRNTEENNIKIEEILKLARRNLAKAQIRQAKHYNKKRSDWSPKVGEIVFKKEFHQSKAVEGFAAKLAGVFGGPFKVKSFISPSVVELVELNDIQEKPKLYRVHLKDLKRVNQDSFHAPI